MKENINGADGTLVLSNTERKDVIIERLIAANNEADFDPHAIGRPPQAIPVLTHKTALNGLVQSVKSK